MRIFAIAGASQPTRPLISALLVVLLGAATSWSAPLTSIESDEDFDTFVTSYYLTPNPELVDDAVRFIGSSALSCEESAQSLLSAFFSEVFERHPKLVDGWIAEVDPADEATRSVLEYARQMKPREIELTGLPLPQLNDIYWSAFFASGRPDYVVRVIDHLAYLRDRDDPRLFLTGASAKWSLASNALAHPLVRKTMEAEIAKRKGFMRRQLQQALKMTPDAIHAATSAVIEKTDAADTDEQTPVPVPAPEKEAATAE